MRLNIVHNLFSALLVLTMMASAQAATWKIIGAASSGGAVNGILEYNSNDTFTVPAGVTSILVSAIGGGGGSSACTAYSGVPCTGGGSGGNSCVNCAGTYVSASGGAGAGGSYVNGFPGKAATGRITVTAGTVCTVIVGGGGGVGSYPYTGNLVYMSGGGGGYGGGLGSAPSAAHNIAAASAPGGAGCSVADGTPGGGTTAGGGGGFATIGGAAGGPPLGSAGGGGGSGGGGGYTLYATTAVASQGGFAGTMPVGIMGWNGSVPYIYPTYPPMSTPGSAGTYSRALTTASTGGGGGFVTIAY